MPKKLHEGGPMMGTDPSLTMGSGMGSGESMQAPEPNHRGIPLPKQMKEHKRRRNRKHAGG